MRTYLRSKGNASLYGVGAAARVSERRIILLRKLATLLSSLVLMLVLASGVALAADFIGNSGNDVLTGTELGRLHRRKGRG